MSASMPPAWTVAMSASRPARRASLSPAAVVSSSTSRATRSRARRNTSKAT
jgi:hypothetical protein